MKNKNSFFDSDIRKGFQAALDSKKKYCKEFSGWFRTTRKPLRTWRVVFIERLKKDKEELKWYMKVSIEEYEKDNDHESFLFAMKTVEESL